MKILRNICIALTLLSAGGTYLGFKYWMYEVITTMAVSTVFCVFMAIYCHGEGEDS